jgi:DHA2 family multidrug resistance protein
MITTLTIVSAIGFVLLPIGQWVAARPVIALKLLLNRQFGSVVAM